MPRRPRTLANGQFEGQARSVSDSTSRSSASSEDALAGDPGPDLESPEAAANAQERESAADSGASERKSAQPRGRLVEGVRLIFIALLGTAGYTIGIEGARVTQSSARLALYVFMGAARRFAASPATRPKRSSAGSSGVPRRLLAARAAPRRRRRDRPARGARSVRPGRRPARTAASSRSAPPPSESRPASATRPRSTRLATAESAATPRRRAISGRLTGPMYATTASVSIAACERPRATGRSKRREHASAASWAARNAQPPATGSRTIPLFPSPVAAR